MKKTIITVMLSGLVLTLPAQGGSQEWDSHSAKRWVAKREWSEGWSVSPHRTTDWRQFARQYHKNTELWQKVFAWLASIDPATHPAGVHIIETDRAWATISEYTPAEAASGNIESHRRFIDLQYVTSGDEKMGLVKPADAVERAPYNDGRDITFYTSDKVGYHTASPDRFFLFFPSDIHQPSIRGKSDKQSRKIVIKIEYAD